MFKKDRKDFEQKWDDLQVFVQYGMLSEDKFAEKANGFTLLKNTDGTYFTIEEYKEKITTLQTDKDGKTIVLYTNNPEDQFSYVKNAKDRGYDVLSLDGPLISHWLPKLEQSNENLSFVRVDADTLDKLIRKTDEIPSKLSKEEEEKLKGLFENSINKEKYNIQFESMSEENAPIVITQPEFIRRMMEQQKLGGGGGFYGAFPEMFTMTINSNHAAITGLVGKPDKKQQATIKQLTDLALLAQGLLKGEALSSFIDRNLKGIA